MKSWEEIKHKATSEQLAQARRELNAVLLPAENADTVREALIEHDDGGIDYAYRALDALLAQAEAAAEENETLRKNIKDEAIQTIFAKEYGSEQFARAENAEADVEFEHGRAEAAEARLAGLEKDLSWARLVIEAADRGHAELEARLAQAQDALRQGTKIAAQYLDTGRGDLDGWIEYASALTGEGTE